MKGKKHIKLWRSHCHRRQTFVFYETSINRVTMTKAPIDIYWFIGWSCCGVCLVAKSIVHHHFNGAFVSIYDTDLHCGVRIRNVYTKCTNICILLRSFSLIGFNTFYTSPNAIHVCVCNWALQFITHIIAFVGGQLL